jgi:outer membrane protein
MKLSNRLASVRPAGCVMLLVMPLVAAAQTPAAQPPTQITPPLEARYQPTSPASSLPLAPSAAAVLPKKIGVASIPTPAANAAITLDQALALAATNEPHFIASAVAAKNAKLDQSIARAKVLPSAIYHNQYLYTESDTAGSHNISPDFIGQPKFINNDLIHHYFSQVSVTETVGLNEYSAIQKANANLAFANAELEVARRGLTSTVVVLFYNMITGQKRVAVQQRALNEAADFLKETQNREDAREVSHYDVIKARIQLQQHERDLAAVQLLSDKARIDLAVLLYPDPRTPYTVTVPEAKALPERPAIEAAASANNAELKSALASYRSSQAGVTVATAAFLPELSLNYAYGIDAPQFAANGRFGERWLGYAASVTLDIPLFDWFATPNRLKQAHISRDGAKAVLTNTQRRVIADLEEFYAATRVAANSLQSLQASANDSREGLRLMRLRYTSGEATLLEVVDAQNTLTNAELALEDGAVAYQLALANLQLLTGTI